MTNLRNLDYFIDVARGSVPGHSVLTIAGRNPTVGTDFEDLWDAGGALVYPTSGEQWEIVSTSTNDAAAGTGARTVILNYLDDSYVEQTEIITLNGTSAVTTVATDIFRIAPGIRVNSWGSAGENQGELIIRVASGGARRSGILLDTLVTGNTNGLNNAQDSHYTVPAGKTVFMTTAITNVSKNHDMVVRLKSRLFGESDFGTVAELSNYQSSFPVDLKTSPLRFTEKTDLKVIARSNNLAVPINLLLSFIIIVN